MGERRRRIDKVLDATFLTNLSEWPLDALRSRHAECLEIETEVSYVRRMPGPVDGHRMEKGPRATHHRRHPGEAAEPRRRRAAFHAARARAAGATGVAAATRAAPGHRPHGGRLDRPAQGGPGVISARE